MKPNCAWLTALGMAILGATCLGQVQSYAVNDTGQKKTYDNGAQVQFPLPGQSFHGQDAQYVGAIPARRDNGDGTVSDLNTGLMWQQTPSSQSFSWQQAVNHCNAHNLAGPLRVNVGETPSPW